MKLALDEKECRVPALSRPRRSEVAARLPERSEDKANRKVKRGDPKEEHHSQGQNSLRQSLYPPRSAEAFHSP